MLASNRRENTQTFTKSQATYVWRAADLPPVPPSTPTHQVAKSAPISASAKRYQVQSALLADLWADASAASAWRRGQQLARDRMSGVRP
jgi:hypothetical protein